MPRECNIPDCKSPILAKGLCRAHYNRMARHGDPLFGGPVRVANGEAHRWIAANAGFSSDECLTWPYRRDEWGRGKLVVGGRATAASRVMCEIVHGPPPSKDHHAAHNCGNGDKACVNPKHLRWATPKENCQDKVTHGTQPFGELCHSAKLSNSQADAIRHLKGAGVLQKEIAAQFGVHPTTISNIWTGRRRSHDGGRA